MWNVEQRVKVNAWKTVLGIEVTNRPEKPFCYLKRPFVSLKEQNILSCNTFVVVLRFR